MSGTRTYRFADASTPGLLVGLSARQAVPLVAAVLWVAFGAQVTAHPVVLAAGPVAGVTVGFGRFRGAPLAEVAAPGLAVWWRHRRGRDTWVRRSLCATTAPSSADAPPGGAVEDLPAELAGLEVIETRVGWCTAPVAVVSDTAAGTVSVVLRARGRGFPLASPDEQDRLVAAWGAALAPLARERTPVARVCWQEWAHPVGVDAHRRFLDRHDVDARRGDPAVGDYLNLVDERGATAVTHDVLVTVTVDRGKVRARRGGDPFTATVDAVLDEARLLADRFAAAGVSVDDPLGCAELATAVRVRSDPTRAALVQGVASLAAAAGRAPLQWAPMAVRAGWGEVAVDGSTHRSFVVAAWPMLPVAADWLGPLLGTAGVTRTVTVVFEPVPTSRAARHADREVLAREADAEMKERRGFRVSARDRKRIDDVHRREAELSGGHPEFRFVGLVDVAAADLDRLDDAAAVVEAAAAQSLVDLRPLHARHHLGWVAALPLGRSVAARRGPR